MIPNNVFAVIEAIDKPKGAILLRYQAPERIAPDPEEERIRKQEIEERLSEIPEDIRDQLKAQLGLIDSASRRPSVTYRMVSRMDICTSAEEVAKAVLDAKEAWDEIVRLTKAGASINPINRALGFP